MNKKLFTASFLILLMATPTFVFAAPQDFVVNVLNRFLSYVLWPIFAGAVVIMFIWAGILYLTAKGDPSKIHTANLTVVWAVIGIIVAILGYKAFGTISDFITSATPTSNTNCDNGAWQTSGYASLAECCTAYGAGTSGNSCSTP